MIPILTRLEERGDKGGGPWERTAGTVWVLCDQVEESCGESLGTYLDDGS